MALGANSVLFVFVARLTLFSLVSVRNPRPPPLVRSRAPERGLCRYSPSFFRKEKKKSQISPLATFLDSKVYFRRERCVLVVVIDPATFRKFHRSDEHDTKTNEIQQGFFALNFNAPDVCESRPHDAFRTTATAFYKNKT